MRSIVGGGATKNGTGRLSWPSVLGEQTQTAHTRSAERVRSLGLDLVVVVVVGGGVVVVVVVVQCEYIIYRDLNMITMIPSCH